jgi:hypothetical protein
MMESKMTKMLLVLCMTAAATVGGVLIWIRGNAFGGSHNFPRCSQKLFNFSKGGVHIRHTPLSCGHQMGLC